VQRQVGTLVRLVRPAVPLVLEYEAVLTRTEHLAACRACTEDVSAVPDELAFVATRVELVMRTRPLLWDPNDRGGPHDTHPPKSRKRPGVTK
jgi:hypothetical protein